jgi:hypothetical protein
MNGILAVSSQFLAADFGNATDAAAAAGGITEIVYRVFGLIGVGIILFTLWKAIQGFAKGDMGKSARVIVGGLLAAILCFNPGIVIGLVEAGGNLVQKSVDTVSCALDDTKCDKPAATDTPAP